MNASDYKQRQRGILRIAEERVNNLVTAFIDPFLNFDDLVVSALFISPIPIIYYTFEFGYGLLLALKTLFTDIKSMPDVLKGLGYVVLSAVLYVLNIVPSIISFFIKAMTTMIYGYRIENVLRDQSIDLSESPECKLQGGDQSSFSIENEHYNPEVDDNHKDELNVSSLLLSNSKGNSTPGLVNNSFYRPSNNATTAAAQLHPKGAVYPPDSESNETRVSLTF